MLLITDARLPGTIREKLIIAYSRWKGSIIASPIRSVVKLCSNKKYNCVSYQIVLVMHGKL